MYNVFRCARACFQVCHLCYVAVIYRRNDRYDNVNMSRATCSNIPRPIPPRYRLRKIQKNRGTIAFSSRKRKRDGRYYFAPFPNWNSKLTNVRYMYEIVAEFFPFHFIALFLKTHVRRKNTAPYMLKPRGWLCDTKRASLGWKWVLKILHMWLNEYLWILREPDRFSRVHALHNVTRFEHDRRYARYNRKLEQTFFFALESPPRLILLIARCSSRTTSLERTNVDPANEEVRKNICLIDTDNEIMISLRRKECRYVE